jgi:hypothetical protein
MKVVTSRRNAHSPIAVRTAKPSNIHRNKFPGRRSLLSSALTALLVGAILPSGADAAVLNFDDLDGYSLAGVPAGYGGLNWTDFYTLDQFSFSYLGATSGSNFAAGGLGGPTQITGTPFDFNGGYLSSYEGGVTLAVTGSANGTTLYSQLVYLDTSPVWFQFDYAGIDTLTFNVVAGNGTGTDIFGLDDFTFNEVIGPIVDFIDPAFDFLVGPGGPLGSLMTLEQNQTATERNLVVASTGSYIHNGGTHTVTGWMHNRGTYRLEGGSLSVAGDEIISSAYGYGPSSATFEQRGGSHEVAGTLTLGDQIGGYGFYNLLDGSLSALNEVIGDAGSGTFNQSGGTNTVGDTLTLGKQAYSTGSYHLDGGSLASSNTVVGDGGSGYFSQTGGTHTVAQTLTLGKQAGSYGYYSLIGGSLTANNVVIGDGGYGNFYQSGGTHTVAQTLTLGKQAGGYGSYQFVRGELFTGDVIVGDSGSGYFSQGYNYPYVDNPIHRVSGTLTLGKQAGGNGNYSISNGLLDAKHIVIGDAGTGYFSQFGGTVEAETLTLGKQASGYGSYDLIFGDLSAGEVVVGDAGVGTFNQGDTYYAGIYGYTPTNTVNGTLTLGKQAGSQGTYNLVRGLLTAKNTLVGDAGSGTFNQSGGEHRVAETLTLGKQAGSYGTYNLSGGELTSSNLVVGDAGTGIINQTGGTNTVGQTLVLGKQAGSNGSYNLKAGALAAKDEIVGDAGNGTFTQGEGNYGYSSSNKVEGTLTLGKQAGGKGVYNLIAGILQAKDAVIGDAGTGVFNQTGGTNTIGQALVLGKQSGSQGSYNLKAGELAANEEIVGDAGTGVFDQTGGTNTVGQALVLGRQLGGLGVYNLRAGALVANDEVVGNAGNGTFTQGEGNYGYSSSNTVNGTLTLGKQAGSNGVYNLLAGVLKTSDTVVGDAGIGTLNQLGGSNGVDGTLTLGKQAEGSGAYNLTAGDLTTDRTVVGDAGAGAFTQSGGTHWATFLTLGQQSEAYGQYTLLNGGLSSFYTVIGDEGTGVFTQTGGLHQTLNLTLGKQAGSSGTYNLRGGDLNVYGNIVDGAGQGSLLISGGSLNFTSSSMFNGGVQEVDVDTLKLSGQGAIKLTNGVQVTFQQAVVHNGKEIRLDAGTNAIFNGAFSGKGPFTGAGTATFNSILNVGDGPITFNVAGNMVLGEHSKSIMQIGGTGRGTGYDAVDVGGTLNLDGELNIVGLNGFTGKLGDVFDLYQAETIWGQFDLLTLLTLGEGLSWKIEYLIDAIGTKDIVRLSVVSSVPLPASVWLLQSALFGLLAMRRYSRKNR